MKTSIQSKYGMIKTVDRPPRSRHRLGCRRIRLRLGRGVKVGYGGGCLKLEGVGGGMGMSRLEVEV